MSNDLKNEEALRLEKDALILDVRGQICPDPQIAAKISNALKSLKGPVDKVNEATEQVTKITSPAGNNGKKPTEANVRAKVDEGGNGMPAYKEILSDEDKDNVIAYLKTL